jgi:hypothetical protein
MPSGNRTGKSSRWRLVLNLEGLEGRELLSSYGNLSRVRSLSRPQPLAGAPLPTVVAGSVTASQVGGNTSDLGPPTPQELAKQRFAARLSGTFETAQGRYQQQPLQGLVLTTGGSNQSLRLQSQMQFFTYTDPSLPPNGQINLSAKNVGNTGNMLLLDLTADPTSLSHGLPSHFTWTVNGASGGVWTGATGQGTLDVHYTVTGSSRGGYLKGKAIVVAQGLVVSNHGLALNTSLPGSRSSLQGP